MSALNWNTVDLRPVRRRQAAHVVWGSIDKPDNDSSSGSARPRGRSSDDVVHLQESSTSDRFSQESSDTAKLPGAALMPAGPLHAPNDLASRGSITALEGFASQGKASCNSEQLHGSEVDSVWDCLSPVEQGDIVAIIVQTVERDALPSELHEFWSKGSRAHGRGSCRPCHYVHTSAGCSKGNDCTFCHIPHTKKGHPRPSSSQRMYGKRFALKLAGLQQSHPDDFGVLKMQLGSRRGYVQCRLGVETQAGGDTHTVADYKKILTAPSSDAVGSQHSAHPLPTNLGGASSSNGLGISPSNPEGVSGAVSFSKRLVSL